MSSYGSPQYIDTLDGEHIESKIMCNVLKVRSFCGKNLALSYTCRAVVPLARNIVLPRLTSRLSSSLKTGFDAVMRSKLGKTVQLCYITIISEGQTTKVREHFKKHVPKGEG